MTSTTIPLAFAEIAQKETVAGAAASLDEMLRWGTYPEIWLAGGERARREALRELVDGHLFKDVIAFESLRNSDKIRRLLKLVAFQIGKEVSLSELATNLGIARQTVERYLDLLEKTFVIYRVNGFSRNLRSEVVKMSAGRNRQRRRGGRTASSMGIQMGAQNPARTPGVARNISRRVIRRRESRKHDSLRLRRNVKALRQLRGKQEAPRCPVSLLPGRRIRGVDGVTFLDTNILVYAVQIKDQYGIQFFDALILAAAEANGCDEILTEDLADGRVYGGVRAVNPFE